MAEELKCQNCGKGFIPTCHITRQKFCSDACRNRYNTAKGPYGVPVNICPECGEKVEQTEGPGRWRRFCSEQCRIEWWREYHKANPSDEEPGKECAMCSTALGNKRRGGKYCSRFCYLLAVNRGHNEEICEWCGEKFLDSSGQGRRYCSRSCWISARYTQQSARRGRRRISADSLEEWKEKLAQAAEADNTEKRRKRVRLVCGTTSMNTGLDGLIAIIRGYLRLDPAASPDAGAEIWRIQRADPGALGTVQPVQRSGGAGGL